MRKFLLMLKHGVQRNASTFRLPDKLSLTTRPALDGRCKGLRLWAAGAICGLIGAVAFPLLITVLVHNTNGVVANGSILKTLTTVATVSVLPLLILGLICVTCAVKRSTPESSGCSPRQLPERVPKARKQSAEEKRTKHGELRIVWWMRRKKGTW